MVRLGDVFERQITGEWGSECLETETGTNILRTTNFTSDGVINYNNVVVRSIEKSKVESKRLHYGDIILEKSGGTDKTPVGRVVFCDPYIETGTYLCNNFTQAMRVNPSMAVPKYVFYFMWNLHWSGKTELMQNKTTGIRNLQVKSYLNQALPLPSLDEQRRIAAMLDKVTDLIFKRRQQLDKLDELVKARFVEMFGDLADPKCQYARCKLVGACVDPDDIKCGPFGTQLSKDEYQESGVAVWEIPQINSGFKEYPTHFLTAEKARQLSAYSLIPGDIAMSRKGNVGRCGLYPKTFKPGIIHSDVLRIRVDSNRVDPCFMMYQLHFSRAVERQIEMVSSGAIMAGINVTKLKHIYVHIPPVNLQRQFTYFVDQTENIKTTISRSLEKLETLKKALMQEYFGT